MNPFDGSRPALTVRELRKTWPGGIEAVRGIDFEVAAAEVFGLLGPNGAGKSTTIGMLTTSVVPSGGTAILSGIDVAADPLAARALSGVVFQDAVVDRSLSGRRNLEGHARLWGVEPGAVRPRAEALAGDFGLADILDRPVATYSGGQRRRLEIARALVSEPRVLFLDEPTVGLDPRIRHELLGLIGGLRARTGMTVVLTTHYLDEAERLCDRIGVMHAGEIVALDTPVALLAAVGAQVLEVRLERELDSGPLLAGLRGEGVAGADAFVVGTTVIVPLHNGSASGVTDAVARLGVLTTAMVTRRPTLDDVYLRLTGDRIAA